MTSAPSEDSDQPGHPPSLIRVFAVRMKKAWVLSYPLSANILIRLGRCPGWSEFSLDTRSFCWFCCEMAQFYSYENLGPLIKIPFKPLSCIHENWNLTSSETNTNMVLASRRPSAIEWNSPVPPTLSISSQQWIPFDSRKLFTSLGSPPFQPRAPSTSRDPLAIASWEFDQQ